MTEKSTIRFIKEKVREMGLRDKMEFFHWLMQDLSKDLSEKGASDSEHIKET
jgi:hypothetical protein